MSQTAKKKNGVCKKNRLKCVLIDFGSIPLKKLFEILPKCFPKMGQNKACKNNCVEKIRKIPFEMRLSDSRLIPSKKSKFVAQNDQKKH